MVDYESDSSESSTGNDVSTTVLLGFASGEPTDDSFSQLGGLPSFFDTSNPSPSLARCKCCNSYMNLLLQINGNLLSRFPLHERRLYLWACKKKQCRRKDGSVRGFRGVRVTKGKKASDASHAQSEDINKVQAQQSKQDIGSAIFGVKPAQTIANPFSTTSSSLTSASNPFSSAPAPVSSLAAKSPQQPTLGDPKTDFTATFAQKARISSPEPAQDGGNDEDETGQEWPAPSEFPPPFPQYHLDAEYEYISRVDAPESNARESHAAFMDVDEDGPSSSAQNNKDDAEAEMTIDKTFQHFADRVAQNPEQVLRYEFGGLPLLYSRSDGVGKCFSSPASGQASNSKVSTIGRSGKGIPQCQNCGASRTFELQLMPNAIGELEADEEATTLLANGMEWGTVILGVCEKDCIPRGKEEGTYYLEEWVGVQWEELVNRKK